LWSSPSLAPARIFSSDAIISYTYLDEPSSLLFNSFADLTKLVKLDLSSLAPELPLNLASLVKVYIRAVVLKRLCGSTLLTQAKSSLSLLISFFSLTFLTIISFSLFILLARAFFDLIDRVKALVQQFKQAWTNLITATEQRWAI
jgi:hypothetical protein